MSMNRAQFQSGLSMPEFIQQYGMRKRIDSNALVVDDFIVLSTTTAAIAYCPVRAPQNLPMQRLPPVNITDCRNFVPREQPAFNNVVFGHLFGQSSQDPSICLGLETTSGRQFIRFPGC